MGRASISMRTLSPAVTITNFPGIDEVLLGAYRTAEPTSIILFKFLNLSPPWATRAARASSSGVVVVVIGGGAGIVETGVLFELPASGAWAIGGEVIKSKTSVEVKLFMAGLLPRIRTRLWSLSYKPPAARGSEI